MRCPPASANMAATPPSAPADAPPSTSGNNANVVGHDPTDHRCPRHVPRARCPSILSHRVLHGRPSRIPNLQRWAGTEDGESTMRTTRGQREAVDLTRLNPETSELIVRCDSQCSRATWRTIVQHPRRRFEASRLGDNLPHIGRSPPSAVRHGVGAVSAKAGSVRRGSGVNPESAPTSRHPRRRTYGTTPFVFATYCDPSLRVASS